MNGPNTLEPLEEGALAPGECMIFVYECDKQGNRVLERCKVATRAGLTHTWTVELYPDNVIRTVRSDGHAWTFDLKPISHVVQPRFVVLEDPLGDDAHAEALTVAELAVRLW